MHGRKILLVIDNYPTHPESIGGLPNVELSFCRPTWRQYSTMWCADNKRFGDIIIDDFTV